ncbi:hypothetical protein V1264_009514 [Littorina saxatilis]|uniref:Uncharacterized protein n=1 Tax=Littorina saxatilis TaxID=31220 RepID=A0AAN9G1H1_9CAEN
MAVPFSNTKLRVPNGFKNVVWVFAREVIRDNPKNIHEYGFRFFTKLLQIRAIEGHDPAQTGAHSEERFYNNWAYKESAKAARTKRFRPPLLPKLVNKSVCMTQKFGVIGAMTYCYASDIINIKNARAGPEYSSDWLAPPKGVSFDEEVIDIDLQGLDLNGPAMEHAAVLIQAQYKGFATRKKYSMEIEEKRHSVSENQREDTMEEIDIDLNDPAVEDAAVKIQAQFKGFKKRKDLERSRSQDQGPGTS